MDQVVFKCEYCGTEQLFRMMTDDNECCACGAQFSDEQLSGTTTRAVDLGYESRLAARNPQEWRAAVEGSWDDRPNQPVRWADASPDITKGKQMLTITVLPNDGSMPYEKRFRNPKNAAKFLESLSGRRPTKRAGDVAESVCPECGAKLNYCTECEKRVTPRA